MSHITIALYPDEASWAIYKASRGQSGGALSHPSELTYYQIRKYLGENLLLPKIEIISWEALFVHAIPSLYIYCTMSAKKKKKKKTALFCH